MERDNKENIDQHSTRPNGRSSAPFVVNREGRKPLFGARTSKDSPRVGKTGGTALTGGNGASSIARPIGGGLKDRPESSGSQSSRSDYASSVNSSGSRIPRPTHGLFSSGKSNDRKPMSLTDAYKLAKEEEERTRRGIPIRVDGSPSPAPRPWRSRQGADDTKTRKLLNEDPLATKGQRTNTLQREKDSSSSDNNARKSINIRDARGSRSSKSPVSDVDQKPSQSEQPHLRLGISPNRENGIFGNSRIGRKVAETGQALARKASSSSLDGRVGGRASDNAVSPGGYSPSPPKRFSSRIGQLDRRGLPSRVSTGLDEWDVMADIPVPSIETGNQPPQPTPPSSRPTSADPDTNQSPNKSYAWQVDAEFTAGDLQFSDSPRITMTSAKDEITGLETPKPDVDPDGPSNPAPIEQTRTPEASRKPWSRPRSTNTKLDEILAREIEVEKEIEASKFPNRPRQNTKLDEIRAREIEHLSKRALATSRLEEIREQNAEARSSPPEVRKLPSREFHRGATPDPETKLQGQDLMEEEEKGGGERIPNTPVTIFRKPNKDNDAPVTRSRTNSGDKESRSPGGSRAKLTNLRDNSRDLLRRLARATSSSPAPDPLKGKSVTSPIAEGEVKEKSDKRSSSSGQSSRAGRKDTLSESKDPEGSKPAVEFSGLRRVRSTDSAKDKRRSMAHSDNDPTERIEGEMQLFAPLENHSERGSIRAPSPLPSSDDDDDDDDDDKVNPLEETPRPLKQDPLLLPTPRVTGAYVETPATAKVERASDIFSNPPKLQPSTSTLSKRSDSDRAGSSGSSFARSKSGSRSSDSERNRSTDKPNTTTVSTVRRRRARSLPRGRRPLINSAKPPSVYDDLLDLRKRHQIDDSTVDDFDEFFSLQPGFTSGIESMLNSNPSLVEDDSPILTETRPKMESEKEELERYDRMNKSLKTGLLGIRTAKQGIERLEGKVAHTDSLSTQGTDVEHPTPLIGTRPAATTTYVQVPVPQLYRRNPTFRFTFFGVIVLLGSLWYCAESTMCSLYCRPVACSSTPCVWSVDDPTWGSALPIKLDQWATGGLGRQLTIQFSQEVQDLIADFREYLAGTNVTGIDVNLLDFDQKRQHRRRLRKKGLAKKHAVPQEHKSKWDAWRITRAANERIRDAMEMGYDMGDGDESMAADQKVW
jgi:hypothetical protein